MIADLPSIKDVGLAAFILFFLIDRAFTWLSRYNLVGPDKKDNDSIGGKPIEYWQMERREFFRLALKEGVTPIFDVLIRIEAQHTEILRLLRNIRADQKNRRRDSDEL